MKRLLSSVLLLLASAAALAQPIQQKAITAINSTPTATCSANSCVVFDMRTQGTAQVQVTGTYTASGGLSLQSTVDGVTWVTVGGSGTFRRLSTGVSTATITSGEQGVYQLSGDCVGAYACRVTALGAVTGSATVSVLTSSATAGGVANISGGAGDASAANQVAGNASLTSIDGKMVAGSGATSAATQRVVAATDSPEVAGIGGVSDAAATQGSTGSVSAKLRTVTSQLNSIDTKTPALGQAVMASSQPVVIASNQSNVPTNVAQINGVTPLMGAGNTGTGSPRVTLATDQAALPAHGLGAVNAAAPTGAQMNGVRSAANMVAMSQPNTTAAISVSTATTTQIVALSSGQVIHVGSLSVIAGGAGNIRFVYGTGTTCGTGTTNLTGDYPLIANAGISLGAGLGPVLVVPAGNALCVTTSAAVQMSGHVTYTQYTP